MRGLKWCMHTDRSIDSDQVGPHLAHLDPIELVGSSGVLEQWRASE